MFTHQLVESKVNINDIFFHGSKEERYTYIKQPSFLHPFYVTTDLHYAMAFCSKDYSSTGEQFGKKYNFDPNQNFCYALTLKQSANFFDFRDQRSQEFKRFFSIIPEEIVNYVLLNNPTADIYSFIVDLEFYVVENIMLYKDDYAKYVEECKNQKFKLLSYRQYAIAAKMVSDLGFDVEIDHPHERLQIIFARLDKLGFDGIMTTEDDINDEMNAGEVHTNCAIGIWRLDAIDMVCITPMKYKWLKKINPQYSIGRTSDSARQKILHYIKLYRDISKTRNA